MWKWRLTTVVLLLTVVVGGTWLFVRQKRFIPDFAQPKYGVVTVGDIRVPITAAGLVHANQVIEVKSEASGEIVRIPVAEGSSVSVGDVLVELDPDDEQRALDQRQADLERAEAVLMQAKVAVDKAEVATESAKVRLAEMEAQVDIAKFELDKVERLHKSGGGQTSVQELNDARARYRMTVAQRDAAEIAIRNAELSKLDAEAAVKSQEATVRSARKAVEDAQERLRKTTIRAPRGGIVTQVHVREGMLVQSATQSFTGGTPLMVMADVSKKKVIARLDEADYGRILAISPVDALPEIEELREAARLDAEALATRSGVVHILVDAFPDETFTGRIARVEPQGKLNPGSSIIQYDVHVEITGDNRHLLPLGAQAQVEFTVENAVGVLRIPADGVQTREGQRGVYVPAPENTTSGERYPRRFVPCRLGITDGEYTEVVEVLDGQSLKENDQVFTRLPRDPGENR